METQLRPAGGDRPRSTGARTASVRVVATSLGTHLLLEVVGEADQDTAQALREDLAAALRCRPRSVTLEISGLTVRDLAGLDALNDFCADASQVVGVPPVVRGMAPRPAWMDAGVPAADGMPPRAVASTAPGEPRSGAQRWRLGTQLGASRADVAATPRPWPER